MIKTSICQSYSSKIDILLVECDDDRLIGENQVAREPKEEPNCECAESKGATMSSMHYDTSLSYSQITMPAVHPGVTALGCAYLAEGAFNFVDQ